MSRLLRHAEQLEREKTALHTLGGSREHLLELEDPIQQRYTGRLNGVLIASDLLERKIVYLTDDQRVIFYDENQLRITKIHDPERELRELLPSDDPYGAYADALHALGLKPVIDV